MCVRPDYSRRMNTVPVQVVCRECGHRMLTRVRGRSTECSVCGLGRYVRQDQQWEGPTEGREHLAAHPALARDPAEVRCRECGHVWASRAASRASIRCPSCQHSCRVPVRPEDRAPTSGPDRPEEAGPAPAYARPSPDMGLLVTSMLRAGQSGGVGWGLPGTSGVLGRGAAVGTPTSGVRRPGPLARLRGVGHRMASPGPVGGSAARPVPPEAAREVVPEVSPWSVGPGTTRVLAPLGAALVHGAGGPGVSGRCTLVQGLTGEDCPQPAAGRLVLGADAWLPVCVGHARALAETVGGAQAGVVFRPLDDGVSRGLPEDILGDVL
jgi:Zn finger protein HypA/HybF involved in hydrogenase expression